MRRPYITESGILPGTGVVQGSKERTVKAPDDRGGGAYIGVYAWEANAKKEAGDAVIVEGGCVALRFFKFAAAARFARVWLFFLGASAVVSS